MEQQGTTKLWTLQYTLIIITTFVFFLSLQALLGGFPAFVAGITEDPSKGGLMTTSFMLAAIFTRPFIGILMHKLNVKKTLIFTMIFVMATIAISFGQETFSVLILLRIFQGISFGIITTLLATLATNLIPNDKIGEGIGYFGMATSLGTTFGPMVALTLVHSFSFNNLLALTFGLMVFAIAGSLFIINKEKAPAVLPVKSGSLLNYAFDKRAFLPCILVCLFYITFSGIVNFIDGLGSANHFGGKVSIFFLIIAGMMILTRPLSGKIYDRMGHKFLIYPASISGIIGLLILTFTHSFSLLCIAAIFYGVAYSVMQPTFQAWAVSRVSPEKKGTANAMSLSFMDLGMAIGAGTLGNVVHHIGYNATYGYSSILIILLGIIYLASSFVAKGINKPLNHSI
ncbi:putative MFS family arabinose efflux permease [Peribacillus deserti]|uniref:MFS family arabinose efflux permease n=1 Tax=Peribacillus deserti TaxID=673318 RepID=A0ABS2QIF4_9BACI|nr:MFS transporter [Peribacillus deserti]MBM7692081.1 putative MFS family arabinose efflux permease [Peribacillus deserti]